MQQSPLNADPDVITVNFCAVNLTFVSTAILLFTIVLIWQQSNNKALKRSRSRWTLFAVGVFCSAFFFSLGLVLSDKSEMGHIITSALDNVLRATFGSIQMINGERDYASLDPGQLPNGCFAFIVFFEHLLSVLSPVAFLGAVASYVSRFLSMPRASFRSIFRPITYVFSDLGEPSLTLAASIRDKHWRSCRIPFLKNRQRDGANLVFTSVNRDSDDELQIRAT